MPSLGLPLRDLVDLAGLGMDLDLRTVRRGLSQALAFRFSQLATVSTGWLGVAARLTDIGIVEPIGSIIISILRGLARLIASMPPLVTEVACYLPSFLYGI